MSRHDARHHPVEGGPLSIKVASGVLAVAGAAIFISHFLGFDGAFPLGLSLVSGSGLLQAFAGVLGRRDAFSQRGWRMACGLALAGALMAAAAFGAALSYLAAPGDLGGVVSASFAMVGMVCALGVQTVTSWAYADKRMPEGGP